MKSPCGAARSSRTTRRMREGLVLTRLSALIALGFMPGLSALAARFNDQLWFRPSDLNLRHIADVADDLRLQGVCGPEVSLLNDGLGSMARVWQGDVAELTGARLANSGGARIIVDGNGVPQLSGSATLDPGAGSELVVNGILQSYSGDGASIIHNRWATASFAAGLITNRGTIRLDSTTMVDNGVIDSWWYFSGAPASTGGVFNKQYGATLRVVGSALTLGGPDNGTINMLAGSRLQADQLTVARGYGQGNNGWIEMLGGGRSWWRESCRSATAAPKAS
jgi:hypothetical protein